MPSQGTPARPAGGVTGTGRPIGKARCVAILLIFLPLSSHGQGGACISARAAAVSSCAGAPGSTCQRCLAELSRFNSSAFPEGYGAMPRAARQAFVEVVMGPDCDAIPADDLRAVMYDCNSVTDCGYFLYTCVNDVTCLGCFQHGTLYIGDSRSPSSIKGFVGIPSWSEGNRDSGRSGARGLRLLEH